MDQSREKHEKPLGEFRWRDTKFQTSHFKTSKTVEFVSPKPLNFLIEKLTAETTTTQRKPTTKPNNANKFIDLCVQMKRGSLIVVQEKSKEKSFY